MQCQKTVVDLSLMSDREIVKFVNEAEGSFCGRFDRSQLNRKLDISKPKWYKPASAIAALLAGLYVFLPSASAKAVSGTEQGDPGDARHDTLQPVQQQQQRYDIISGTIKSDDGSPVPGASVYLKTTNKGTQSDTDGRFKLYIPNDWKDTCADIEVRYIGAITQHLSLSLLNKNVLNVTLHDGNRTLGETMVVMATKRRNPLIRLFKRNRYRSPY